jgi:hypothetical protein
MYSLEISSVGSACGKNPYESRDKTIFTQLCKSDANKYRTLLIEQSLFVKSEKDYKEEEFRRIYKKFKSNVKDPNDFSFIEKEVLKEFKIKEPEVDTERLVGKLRKDLQKDCGVNNEKSIISKKKYTKGNNKIWIYKHPSGWELKGLHDASDGEIVIELKTRMKFNNVRKNKYDLYQLFGYLLAMGKTNGKIVQKYGNDIFDSDIETDNEFGIIDITNSHKAKYEVFLAEIHEFFIEVQYYNDKVFDVHKVFGNLKVPVAEYSEKVATNILPGYGKIVKMLM